ncbi:hypothetical protein F4780DRAFT_107858 [Xylariomycetidae sp. FL0641]|nr:hypothetical protein F4780DRAFT_107858 [Xylariomycetidae sp. FL0641]
MLLVESHQLIHATLALLVTPMAPARAIIPTAHSALAPQVAELHEEHDPLAKKDLVVALDCGMYLFTESCAAYYRTWCQDDGDLGRGNDDWCNENCHCDFCQEKPGGC